MAAATTRLTKPQLLARIDEIEAECAASIRREEALRAELCAYQVAERPSRRERSSTDFAPTTQVHHAPPVVYLHGAPHYKLRDARTRVVTYRPVV